MAYAHSKNDQGVRHDLVDHLTGVGALTREFAEAFGADEAGYWIGLWHDLGKFDPKWQQYLLASEADPTRRHGRIDHKAAGTLLAMKHLGTLGLLIHGHHGGLRNGVELNNWLAARKKEGGVAEADRLGREAIPNLEPSAPINVPSYARGDKLSHELFLRMLFSALIDADRLDTEGHANADRTAIRGSQIDIDQLWERFERNQHGLHNDPDSLVHRVRNDIYQACLDAAATEPGLFRLSVPTGGGKTRSAMAFALQHALRHGMRRVIVAVPYVSITQQTAEVYRSIFGDATDDRPTVLEHHSGGVREAGDDDEFTRAQQWARLAAENWDAPIVVTTTVQLFESLFNHRTSATRKLHRLARSVIILDEAQALPPHLLKPILDALRQLCANYGATVVLSTATQPAFEVLKEFADLGAREMVPEPARYFELLKRNHFDWRLDQPVSWDDVAAWMREEPQALAIVNTKRDALELLAALDDPSALHLSTLLCGAHRSRVLQEVRRRLQAHEPCRLVSTQVVEAGVDLDFPVVLRALGPLDSIIQAAGRCNREGRLAFGRVIVFEPIESRMPRGAYTIGTAATRWLLGGGPIDPDDPETARRYYAQFLGTIGDFGIDRERIQEKRERFDFLAVSDAFRMIDDEMDSVVVSYGTDDERVRVQHWLEQLRGSPPNARQLLRWLQSFVVSVRHGEAQRYERVGLISPVRDGLGEWMGGYHDRFGLTGRDVDPESLVI